MKKSIITILLVLLVGLVALGFYRGWFALSSHSPDAGNNKVDLNLTIDPDKVKDDADTLKDKAAELTGQTKTNANAPGSEAKER